MTHLNEVEKWFKSQIAAIGAMSSCVGSRKHNSFPPAKIVFPYLVWRVIPLKNTTAQLGQTIQSRFLLDAIIYSALPLPATVDAAIAGMNEHFESPTLVRQTDNVIISISAENPINRPQSGANPDEKIIGRGTSFKLWVADL